MKLNTINEFYQGTVDKYSENTALVFKEQKYTFAELDKLVKQVASYLNQNGVKKQDRVIIYMPHMPQWIAAWLALQKIGAIAVPVTHFYGYEELKYIAEDCGAEVVFCTDANLEQVIEASKENNLFKNIAVVNEKDSNLIEKNEGSTTAEIIPFEQILNIQDLSIPLVSIDKKDISELLYTGGTTGYPKGVPIKNVSFLEAINTKRKEYESLVPFGQGIAVQGAPLNHIMGQELGLGALLFGDSLVLMRRLDLEDLFYHIEKYRANIFFGTPTLCRMILDHEKLDGYDLSSLKYVFTAGEALPPEIGRRWKEKFGTTLYHGYGSTETCGGITGMPVGEDFPEGTAGKVVPTKKVKVVDPDTLEPLSTNEAGEMLVSSENMVTGYWNKPEETEKHFVELEGRLWFRTGDIVRFDENGWFFFVDRSADLIKHKGYRVAATKVESVLYKHSSVFECCVVGVPDPDVGEKVKARVILKDDRSEVTEEELINWCKETLASYEIPVEIEFCDELPKSPVGKILRRKVRDEERGKKTTSR